MAMRIRPTILLAPASPGRRTLPVYRHDPSISRPRLAALAAALSLSLLAAVSWAQAGRPQLVTVSGLIVDVTCAVKHKAMTDSWHNAENNKHKTEEGVKPACAEMCLRGGQPAGLYANGRIEAGLACNPRMTLADYAAQEVELQGYWGGGKYDRMRTFIPQKIRKKGEGEWKTVNCLTMHN